MLEYGRLYTDETEPGSNDFTGDECVLAGLLCLLQSGALTLCLLLALTEMSNHLRGTDRFDSNDGGRARIRALSHKIFSSSAGTRILCLAGCHFSTFFHYSYCNTHGPSAS